MGLKDRVSSDLKDAMRSRDQDRLNALRLLQTAIKNLEVARTDPKNAQHGQPVTEGDLVGVVQKEIKQRQDSIEQFDRAGRDDLARRERAEIEFLQPYLPQQLTRAQIAEQVDRIIANVGRDFRQVMPVAARELKGQADGRLVNEVVKERTGQ
jgi:uncharacterized protein